MCSRCRSPWSATRHERRGRPNAIEMAAAQHRFAAVPDPVRRPAARARIVVRPVVL
ncbi:hypothetical protein [Lysobacter gummosus]|uniref:hypothetical protein n=1 Tax=Lysobacter gummosus TaxID=262324 RepID=UPI00362CE71A